MKCKEEEGLDDQQVCNQEWNSSLDQEDPEHPQIKEELDELCISQEGEHLLLKQETEGIIVWTGEERRKLLDTIWKPEIKLHRTDLPQQHVCKKEGGLDDQQVYNQERNSSLDPEDPELPQIKQEPEELCTSQEREPLVQKQEADTFMVPPTNSDQLLSYNSPEPESCDQDECEHVDSGSTINAEPKTRRPHRNGTHRNKVENSPVSESQHKIGKKSVKCDTCGKTFQFKSRLTKHLRAHTGEKPYLCSTCGKGFSYKSHLKRHQRIHTGEKPHSCSTCGKSFIQMPQLITHMRVHTGEKPYSCSSCGKRFGDLSAFRKHKKIHTGEKPHSCSTCGKRFIQMMHVRRHMRIHID
ncbi:zinc finger protein 250-like [Archocentrus centrarchus]|uniref:zinc finger protein 250-like n=1 Tax=Archocentrus centrarchus TaxID=63155 RepID=UPI0011EA396B|nr:zinc finger protein 250-like [Archocentrus centrarchus]